MVVFAVHGNKFCREIGADLAKDGAKSVDSISVQHPMSILCDEDQVNVKLENAEMAREKAPEWGLVGLALAYHALGRKKESEAALAELIDKYGSSAAFQVAEVYAFRGEANETFECLERARAQRDGALIGIKGNPFLKSIEHDPRYTVLLQEMRPLN